MSNDLVFVAGAITAAVSALDFFISKDARKAFEERVRDIIEPIQKGISISRFFSEWLGSARGFPPYLIYVPIVIFVLPLLGYSVSPSYAYSLRWALLAAVVLAAILGIWLAVIILLAFLKGCLIFVARCPKGVIGALTFPCFLILTYAKLTGK